MRRWTWWLLAVLLVTAGLGLLGVPFLVAPASDDASSVDVDAVLVLGPPTDDRVAQAWEIVDAGHADHLLISWDPEEADDYPMAAAACATPTNVVACTMPEPFTTRGEAQWLRDEAAANGWTSVAVLTFTPHVSRARMIVQRCFDGEVAMIDAGADEPLYSWAYQYVYQTAGLVKALLQGGCGEEDAAAATAVWSETDEADPSDVKTDSEAESVYAAGQQTPEGFPDAATYAQEVFAAANETRRQRGLTELEWSECLADLAVDRANTTLPLGDLVHAQTGIVCADEANYAGENLAHGIFLPDQMVEAWLGSPAHRAALLDERFTTVGIGCVASSLEDSSRAAASGDDVGGMLCSMNLEGYSAGGAGLS